MFKQLYSYGTLDTSPAVFDRNFGMNWGINAWLIMSFLQTLSEARVGELKARIADEIDTTFKTHYSQTLSLRETIQAENIQRFAARKTGDKYIINPALDLD